MANRPTPPAGLRGDALWRWQIENRRRAQEADRQAEADNQARLAARLQIPPADRSEEGGASIGDVAKDVYGFVTHGPMLPEPNLFEKAIPGVGTAWNVAADIQRAPKIPRPGLPESLIPVVGPAWEAAADLQDGNYAGAGFNGAMAALDMFPAVSAAKGIRAAEKGIGILKKGAVTANAAGKGLRRVGMAGPGEEIHHSIGLNGLGRTVQSWKNHYAFLKVLPKEVHRRIHGRFNNLPRFGPFLRIIHGTPDWMKEIPAGAAGMAGDAWENLTHPFGIAPPPGRARRSNQPP